MSDLAPFVAAALRDRVVMEQQKEIQSLQQRVSALQEELHPTPRRARIVHVPTQEVFAEDDQVELPSQSATNSNESSADRVQLFTGGAIDVCFSVRELAETQIEFSLAPTSDNDATNNQHPSPVVKIPLRNLSVVSCSYFKCGYMQETYAYFRMEDFNIGLQFYAYMGPMNLQEYSADFVQVPPSELVSRVIPGCSDAVVYDSEERWIRNDTWWQTLADKPVKIALDEGLCLVDRNFLKSIGKVTGAANAVMQE